jgi:hypothetical protein
LSAAWIDSARTSRQIRWIGTERWMDDAPLASASISTARVRADASATCRCVTGACAWSA